MNDLQERPRLTLTEERGGRLQLWPDTDVEEYLAGETWNATPLGVALFLLLMAIVALSVCWLAGWVN